MAFRSSMPNFPTALLVAGLLVPAAVPTVAQHPDSAPGAPAPSWFTGRTMRVDYFHTARGDTRIVTLDRVVDDGEWAGSRTRWIDDTNLGPYQVRMLAGTTGELLYTRGFASIYGEWETAAASRSEWRTFHDSVRLPWPRMPVRIVLDRRQPDQSFEELWETRVDPGSRFVNRAPPVQSGVVTVLQDSGAPDRKVDLLLVGDGYTADQGADLVADATRMTDALFRQEPYRSRKGDFNVRVLHAPSSQQGVHRPRDGSPRRTPLSAEYNVFDTERYMLTLDNRSLREIAGLVPYEALVVLVNERQYGGGGVFNAHATVAAKNQFADYVFVHEFSHHFAALADEYYTSDVAYETGLTNRPEPWEPNLTALKSKGGVKWRDLVSAGTPVPTPWRKNVFDEEAAKHQAERKALRERHAPEEDMDALFRREQEWQMRFFAGLPHAGTVGAYEGAGYETRGLYRPEADCLMFSRNPVGFCRVCRRAIERVIDLHVRP